MTQLLVIPKSQFQKCFGQQKNYWNKYVVSDGNLKGIRTATPGFS